MERNKAYLAFDPNDVAFHGTYDGKEIEYQVPKEKTRTLYDGRYCAVAGFIFGVIQGKYCVLANKRGVGTPDFQGYWNCPCGFLERGENSCEGIARETAEECGVLIDVSKFKPIYIQTEPEKCNNGNVTIHHVAFVGNRVALNTEVKAKDLGDFFNKIRGEINEVSDVSWIPVDNIDNFKWAFYHEESIAKYMPPKWKRRIIEWYYKIFKK